MTRIKKARTLADCRWLKNRPACYHCGKSLPDTTPVEIQGNVLIAHCKACGVSDYLMDWQPAVIASHEIVARLHREDPGQVTKYAGQTIRVREEPNIPDYFIHEVHSALGCTAKIVVVHPDDAHRLWPEMPQDFIALCVCVLHTD